MQHLQSFVKIWAQVSNAVQDVWALMQWRLIFVDSYENEIRSQLLYAPKILAVTVNDWSKPSKMAIEVVLGCDPVFKGRASPVIDLC